ncbi:MAG: oxaloacetate decarboxylase [Lachnospiraceae bacterium]|nr:oxaloacetate decarboxylase [Lachnospiraceae bacterium]
MNGKKVLSIIVLILGVLIVLSNIAPMIVGAIMRMQISNSIGSSMGIIGGADGPTAIMVAGIVGATVFRVIAKIVVGVLLIVAGILGIKKDKG